MTTEQQQQQFKQMVREQWTAAAEAWDTQHERFAEMSKDVTDAIVEAADLAPGMHVLDLAGGTGEPGLTVAKRVAPGGTVVCTDLVEPMLAAAEKNAKERGLDNMTFQVVDMEQIPFEDNRFDRVTSRFGIMFPPDPPRALREIRRVLKPGGRAAFTVWSPAAENPMFAATNSVLQAHGLLQPPQPGAPTPFAFAEPGSLSARLREAGFNDVHEEKSEIKLVWNGTPDEHISFMRSTLPNLRKALDEASPDVVEEIRASIGNYYDGQRVTYPGVIYVAWAVK